MSARPLSLGVAALTVGAFLALPGGAAHAEGTSNDAFITVSDHDSDPATLGVYRRDPWTGTSTVVVAESETVDVQEVTASRDGSRFAYVVDRYSADGLTDTAQIEVRDASTNLVRVVDRHTTSTTSSGYVLDLHPALSPDGDELVWTQLYGDDTTSGVRLRKADLGTGVVTTVSGAVDELAWTYLDSSTLVTLGLDTSSPDGSCTQVQTRPVAGGSPTAVPGLDCERDGEFALSPDGTRLAWTHLTSDPAGDGPQTADIQVADVTLTDGSLALSNTVTKATGLNNSSPTWSTDGTLVRFLKNDDATDGPGDVWSVAVAGTDAPTADPTDVDETSLARVTVDTVAPTATVTAQPFTLAGRNARIAWTLTGADADLSGVRVSRTGGAGFTSVVVPLPAASYIDTGLTVGTTYEYQLEAIDRSGNVGAAVTRQLTAIQPFTTFADPTSTRHYTSPAFRVYVPAQGTKTISVRTNGTGALVPWVTDGAASSYVYTGARPGYSYGFLVTVKDEFGNSSAPTGGGTTVVPYDQTKLAFGGTVLTQRSSDRYLGSATLLRAAGASGRMVVNGNRLQVVGERCASCGVMDVYVDGVRVAGIDTRAASRQARQVLYTRAIRPGVNHTVVIKARGTAGRPNVVLDGLAVRH